MQNQQTPRQFLFTIRRSICSMHVIASIDSFFENDVYKFSNANIEALRIMNPDHIVVKKASNITKQIAAIKMRGRFNQDIINYLYGVIFTDNSLDIDNVYEILSTHIRNLSPTALEKFLNDSKVLKL